MSNDITSIGRSDRYDAVIVGARAAGAATTMLLARQGLRVLAVDRDGYGSDTLSTHALMRGAVTQLERWGIAPLLRAQTPDITKTTFHYGDISFDLDTTSEGTSSPLMAPRRTILDRALVDAAREAGAEVRHETKLVAVDTHPSGQVVGIEIEDKAGRRRHVQADVVIGADGLNSAVARHLDVPVTRQGTEASAYVIRYVENLDLQTDSFQWLYRPTIGAGYIPTVDGQFAVFAGMTRERFRTEIREDVEAGYHRVLDEVHAEFGEAMHRSTPAGPLRSWPGRPGQFRKAFGPGWALVGDAGYFKDPYAAHGISDALRDAELVSDAVISGDYAGYEQARNELSAPLFDALEDIASYRWTLDELPAMHLRLGKAMSAEQKVLAARRAEENSRSELAAA